MDEIFGAVKSGYKHLGISGGSTKISGLAGACEVLILEKGYKPNIISAISAGAILALPIALGKWKETIEAATNFNLDTIFSVKPVNEEGEVTLAGIKRLLTGKESLGEQYNLVRLLREIITPEDYENYLKHDKYPAVYIGVVDFKNITRKFFNLKELSYVDYFKITLASTSMPTFTTHVAYNDMLLYDGGVTNHIGTPWVLENIKGIAETVSIYSRSENYDLIDTDWKPSNILSIVQRYIYVNTVGVSKANEQVEDLLCEKLNIKQTKIFLPIRIENMYDVDRNRILNMYNIGKLAVEKYYKK